MDSGHGSTTSASAGTSATTAATASANKPLVFSKMESLVREMQDPESGVPIRSQKLFLTSIPSAFMGYDLVEWLMDRLEVDDSAEAIHLANLLCQFGYFFPVGETRSLIVKDDSSLYRFQTPYYWPSQSHNADTTDYAIYLSKRQSRNKQKHGLEDYELESYNKLKKGLQHKWDFVQMQAEEQVRLAKDKKKGDKIVTDSQERAYWRVYRPPPGYNNSLENAPVPDRNNMANRVKKKTVESTKLEIEILGNQIERTRMKATVAGEGLLNYSDTYSEYDPFLFNIQPSNPWVTDDVTYWLYNEPLVEALSEKRVRRWSISFAELINDPTGLNEFTNYLRKEYCHENIRFWQAVLDLRYGPATEVNQKVLSIYEEFLKPGAPCEINIDGKTMEVTQQMMKTPTRYTYDLAVDHVYVLLLKKDCYPRFLRSEHYKNLQSNAFQPSQKKRFFSFGPGKKKPFGMSSSNNVSLQAQTPQPLKRHGSDEQANVTQGGLTPSVETHGQSTSTLTVLQPRIDCDPPYRDRPNESVVCPWEEEPADKVCPWDTAPPTQTFSAQSTEPSRLQQSLHRSLPPKSHLSKPRPDRTRSMEVMSSPKHESVHSDLSTTAGNSSAEISTSNQKIDEQPLHSKEVSHKERKSPAANVLTTPSSSPKELFLSSLAPSENSSQTSERRASEGILRVALEVCPLEEAVRISQIITTKESDIKLRSLSPERKKSREEQRLSPDKNTDYSIRSDHLRDILKLGDDSHSPEDHFSTSIAKPSSEIEQSIASSMAAITCGIYKSDSTTHRDGKNEKEHNIYEQVLNADSTTTQQAISVVVTGETSSSAVETKISEDQVPSFVLPKTSSIESAPLEEQKAKSTTEVCPWEDDSLTPTWL